MKYAASILVLAALAAACNATESQTPILLGPLSVELEPDTVYIAVGEPAELTASVFNVPVNSPALGVRLTVVDSAIASVTPWGEVRGRAPGTTRVRAQTTMDPTVYDSTFVIVTAAAPSR